MTPDAAPAPADPTNTLPAFAVGSAESVMLFWGAHRQNPFIARRAVIIDEVSSRPGTPATEDDPGESASRIVNVLVFNSAQHDHGRPEVEQVLGVMVLPPGTKLKEGEETTWEWPALNFVSASAPEVEPRPEAPQKPADQKADATPPAERRSRRKPADQPQA